MSNYIVPILILLCLLLGGCGIGERAKERKIINEVLDENSLMVECQRVVDQYGDRKGYLMTINGKEVLIGHRWAVILK